MIIVRLGYHIRFQLGGVYLMDGGGMKTFYYYRVCFHIPHNLFLKRTQ